MHDDGWVPVGASLERVEELLGRPPLRSVIRPAGDVDSEVEFWVYPARPRGHRTEVLFDEERCVAAVSVRPWRVRWSFGDGIARAVVERG